MRYTLKHFELYIICIFNLLLFSVQQSYAQVWYPDDYTIDYYETVVLKNYDHMKRPIIIKPTNIYSYLPDSIPDWNILGEQFDLTYDNRSSVNINILPIQTSFTYNSKYPRGYNDGPIWNGKGANINLIGGVVGKIGILHFTLAPTLSYAQNQDFFIPSIGLNKNEFSYPFEQKIDWAQRYGDDPYYNFHLGQSEVRLIYKNATLGLSSANETWGVSKYNPILMSNNAGGYPRIDIGTATPAKTKIGYMEFKMHWGELEESSYFDENTINDRRYITGWTYGYEPKFVRGLSLGLSRIMYARWADGDLSMKDVFAAWLNNSHSGVQKNDDYDQMMAVNVKYAFPEVGFETYLEYTRNDFPGNFNDLFEHPDRSRGRTLGFLKTFDLNSGKVLKVVYENTTISTNQIQIIWPTGSPTYYVHSFVDNGYTHNGQIIGTGIGPGSNTDVIKTYLYQPKGIWEFEFQRIRFNDDFFVNAYSGNDDFPTDYEVSLGAKYLRFINNFSIQSKILWSYRKNFYYQDDVEISNFQIELKSTYRFRKR